MDGRGWRVMMGIICIWNMGWVAPTVRFEYIRCRFVFIINEGKQTKNIYKIIA